MKEEWAARSADVKLQVGTGDSRVLDARVGDLSIRPRAASMSQGVRLADEVGTSNACKCEFLVCRIFVGLGITHGRLGTLFPLVRRREMTACRRSIVC